MIASSDNDLMLACKLVSNQGQHDRKEITEKLWLSQTEINDLPLKSSLDNEERATDNNNLNKITFFVKDSLRSLLSRDNSLKKKMLSAAAASENSSCSVSHSAISKEILDTSCRSEKIYKESRMIRLDSVRRVRRIQSVENNKTQKERFNSNVTTTLTMSLTDLSQDSVTNSSLSMTGNDDYDQNSESSLDITLVTRSSSSRRKIEFSALCNAKDDALMTCQSESALVDRSRFGRRKRMLQSMNPNESPTSATSVESSTGEKSLSSRRQQLKRSTSMRKLRNNKPVEEMTRQEKMMMMSGIMSNRSLRNLTFDELNETSPQLPPRMPSHIKKRNSAIVSNKRSS